MSLNSSGNHHFDMPIVRGIYIPQPFLCASCQLTLPALIKEYVNTTIRLADADPSFAGTLTTNGVTAAPLRTKDNIVFKIAEIDVKPYTFPVS